MLGLRKIIGTVLMIVAFLVLASAATLIYNTDQKQKAEIADNAFLQKSQAAIGTLVGASEGLADANLQKNIGLGTTVIEAVKGINWRGFIEGTATSTGTSTEINSEVVNEIESDKKENNFWSKLKKTAKKELASDQAEVAVDPFKQSFFDYQKTDVGAEIIFRADSGREYKLPLPFKVLTKF